MRCSAWPCCRRIQRAGGCRRVPATMLTSSSWRRPGSLTPGRLEPRESVAATLGAPAPAPRRGAGSRRPLAGSRRTSGGHAPPRRPTTKTRRRRWALRSVERRGDARRSLPTAQRPHLRQAILRGEQLHRRPRRRPGPLRSPDPRRRREHPPRSPRPPTRSRERCGLAGRPSRGRSARRRARRAGRRRRGPGRGCRRRGGRAGLRTRRGRRGDLARPSRRARRGRGGRGRRGSGRRGACAATDPTRRGRRCGARLGACRGRDLRRRCRRKGRGARHATGSQ